MTDSILDSVKANCNLEPDSTEFDADIIMYINSELADLHQIGIGPALGFEIEDNSATWTQFLEGNKLVNQAKKYVTLGVRLAFDSANMSSYLIASFEKQRAEAAYRLNLTREEAQWVSSTTS